MKLDMPIRNTCSERKNFCIGCNNHFMRVRPMVREVIVSKHFVKDMKDDGKMKSLVNNILDCSHLEFNELHKFEESLDGVQVFRAKRESIHIVYCVDKDRIMFLRAIRNFEEYKKFIDDKKEITSMIESL